MKLFIRYALFYTVANIAINYSTPNLLYAQTLIDLGTFGGTYSQATALNSSGEVVGSAMTASGDYNAFLYSNGNLTNLGALPGDNDSGGSSINNSGTIVGYSSVLGSGIPHAFIYSNGGMSSFGGNYTSADGINNLNQIVGISGNTAYLYSGGTMTSIGTLGGSQSDATAINDSTQIVGVSTTVSGNGNAFLYNNGQMINLGTLGGSYSQANGINNLGDVVGYSYLNSVNNNYDAFLYSQGKMMDIGTLGGTQSIASGINNLGQIVGYSTTMSGITDAYLYSSKNGMQDLNILYGSLLVSGTGSQQGFVSLTYANAINDNRWIVGGGVYWNGNQDLDEAFLLSPSSVPEPSTFVLIAACSLLWFSYRSFKISNTSFTKKIG